MLLRYLPTLLLCAPLAAAAATSATLPTEASLAELAAQDIAAGAESTSWSGATGIDQDAGRLEITLTPPAIADRSDMLIRHGTDFQVWIWNGEVHAKLGSGETFRPAHPPAVPLTPDAVHVITVSWDKLGHTFAVLVDGRVLTYHPAWTLGAPASSEPVQIGHPTNEDTIRAAFALYDQPARLAPSCTPIGTLDQQPIDPGSCGLADVEPVRVCWHNPTQNEDGSPLTDLDRIRVYWRTGAGAYAQTASQAFPAAIAPDQCEMLPLAPGGYVIAATAIDADGNESVYSNEVPKTVAGPTPPETPPPAPPILLTDPQCDACEQSAGNLTITTTGEPVTLGWAPVAGAARLEVEMVEYPAPAAALPVARGVVAGDATSWTWIPGRSGLYVSRVRSCPATGGACGAWMVSAQAGQLFYIGLATPGDGGVIE